MTPLGYNELTHWGRVTHICASQLTIIGSDNGLLPGRHQTIIWTNAGILLIGTWGTKFGEIIIEIELFSLKKIHFKILSAKVAAILSRPQCVKTTTYWINNMANAVALHSQDQRSLTRLHWVSHKHDLWSTGDPHPCFCSLGKYCGRLPS